MRLFPIVVCILLTATACKFSAHRKSILATPEYHATSDTVLQESIPADFLNSTANDYTPKHPAVHAATSPTRDSFLETTMIDTVAEVEPGQELVPQPVILVEEDRYHVVEE
ncbi:hypothetical protein FHW36_10965 [Chitinophaga polysaccharea]|uniref:Uncharacterized protein n=1 Tax=Chitinophaga polysaccharea TaxID=1293035 RepID=A0A561PB30_9BACT|nr:hypothetical protein [Chitinophaga polysaccharea]TWF35278.1 hypothetical protein FHW36_10965 [Chitinophaga polysaccharea]